MDERVMRCLLERAAESAGPPSTVDIRRARKVGRRRLWLRRAGLAGSASGLVMVAAVTWLTATGRTAGNDGRQLSPATIGKHLGVHPTPVTTWAVPVPAGPGHGLAAFSPLVPFATFGWLPAGYSATGGVQSFITPTTEVVLAQGNSGAQLISLTLVSAGLCHLTGPAPQPSTLACSAGQIGARNRLTDPATQVAGRSAFWAAAGHLVFLYAPHSWAELSITGRRAPRATLRNLLVQVANHLAYGAAPALSFPFYLTGLPANWQVGESVLGTVRGGLIGTGLSIGPAGRRSELSIQIGTAGSPGYCGHAPGQLQVTVNGARGVLRTPRAPGSTQELCFGDYQGLALDITTSLAGKVVAAPVVAARQPLGVIDIVLRHLVVVSNAGGSAR